MLEKEQAFAFSAVSAGHNTLICGQAGTGKTFLVKNIASQMKNKKEISLLCTTGISSLQYHELGATTVHSWAGLLDGRYDALSLQHLIENDDKYDKVRRNVCETDLVIIDEVSMLSMREFELFELVCRCARKNNSYFGGLQVVLCGDFYQLPPVGNAEYNDEGKFCFQSQIFEDCITHRFNLTQVIRQSENILVRAVRETALGGVSEEVDSFLKSLDRPLQPDQNTVHLFPRNIDATLFNNDCLTELYTEGKTYKATKNIGPNKKLKKILAPYYLNLKLNCPVILLRNLGGKLVNGSRGNVTSLEDDLVYVDFGEIGIHPITRHLFSVYSVVSKSNIAEREQFPLLLAYGLTIHKSQGMTLNSVHVHCKGIFQAGQLSVAIGRATSSSGLALSDYRKGLCPQPKSVITKFYGKESGPLCDDLSCCKKIHQPCIQPAAGTESQYLFDSEDSDFDLMELDTVEETYSDTYDLPAHIVPQYLKMIPFTQNAVTDTQRNINQICQNLDDGNVLNFCCWQHKRIKEKLSDGLEKTASTPKEWTSILSDHHLYVSSKEYISKLAVLFGPQKITNDHVTVACEIVLNILKAEVANIAGKVKLLPGESTWSNKGQISEAGKSKIRYVGGMCVAKVRNHYCSVLLRNIGNPEVSAQEVVKSAQKKMEYLNEMVADLDARDIHDKSLEEIERKQNVQRSLTYITDLTYQFFLNLNDKVNDILNTETLKFEKENIFEITKLRVEEDDILLMLFHELFKNTDNKDNASTLYSLYKEITYKYLMVCHKQLLKDTKDKLSIVKKQAHRQEILKKKEKRKSEVQISIKDIRDDQSQNKESSHLKLKMNCLSNESFFTGSEFTKKDLQTLCTAYEVSFQRNIKKNELAASLRSKILSSDQFSNAGALHETSAECGPSVSKKRMKAPSKGKGKGKGKSSRGKNKYYCGSCKEEYIEGEDWIQCDDCNIWYHRTCADLEDDTVWDSLQEEETPWLCEICMN